MPDNACVKTEGDHSAIYWSERVEEGAMGRVVNGGIFDYYKEF
jgi:hypothetical protein